MFDYFLPLCADEIPLRRSILRKKFAEVMQKFDKEGVYEKQTNIIHRQINI